MRRLDEDGGGLVEARVRARDSRGPAGEDRVGGREGQVRTGRCRAEDHSGRACGWRAGDMTWVVTPRQTPPGRPPGGGGCRPILCAQPGVTRYTHMLSVPHLYVCPAQGHALFDEASFAYTLRVGTPDPASTDGLPSAHRESCTHLIPPPTPPPPPHPHTHTLRICRWPEITGGIRG